MKHLVLLLSFLFTSNLLAAEYELAPLISNKDAKDIAECKYNISSYKNEKECITKDNYDKVMRAACARQSGHAKSDFSAKKIYKNCLEEARVLDK